MIVCIFQVICPKILLKAYIHSHPFTEIVDAVCCYNMSCNILTLTLTSHQVCLCKCLNVYIRMSTCMSPDISLWLPQYVCMCVCMVTQFQGCG